MSREKEQIRIHALEQPVFYTLSAEDEGQLLRQIAQRRMGLSRRQFTSAKFREGGVTVDGQSALANRIMHAGETLCVRLREDGARHAPVEGDVEIAYEDEDLLVVVKSAPLPTQSSQRQTGDTLEARMGALLGGRSFRPVNRLDKGTSGLMVVAKHAQAQAQLQKLLHSPAFVREYLALVEGGPEMEEGVVDLSIGKAEGATVRREVRPDGKTARTGFRVLLKGERFSLVQLHLDTGRTHQIRVHMAYLGHPVAGDFLYGRELPEELPRRFALHSAYIRFPRLATGEAIELISPLPQELARLLPGAEKIDIRPME